MRIFYYFNAPAISHCCASLGNGVPLHAWPSVSLKAVIFRLLPAKIIFIIGLKLVGTML